MAKLVRAIPLLLVDDDPLIHQSLRLILGDAWKIHSALRPSDIDWNTFYPVALIDMHLDKNSKTPEGPEIIKKISELFPQTEIVAISGDLDQKLMENCLHSGAQRFLAKPLHAEEVHLVLNKIAAWHELRQISASSEAKNWIGHSDATQRILKQIASLKGETNPVLIEGESGTGKEVVASLLNQQEGGRPFVCVHTGAIPENIFESEFFGHIKGAFTGADQNKIGLCEAAQGGDLFLDEIEAMPLTQQVKLLRFLESGEIKRVGAKESIKIQTRVICASNRALKKMVESGEFREDLYHRINAHHIQLPPLRNRIEDIPLLAEFFLSQVRPKRNKTFAPEAIETLQAYAWSGNVRELKRICEQLSLVTPLPIIRKQDVQSLLSYGSTIEEKNSSSFDLAKGLEKLLAEHETKIIKIALKKYPDVEQAATVLGVSRSSLYKRIKDYSIDLENL